MTIFLLIRHALHVLGGNTIAGRMPDVHLSERGHAQAALLPERLAGVPLQAIYCSPLERTRETGRTLADARGLPLCLCDELLEIDYGEWTGRDLDELRLDAAWQQWNTFRSGHRPPRGESTIELQARVMSQLVLLKERHVEQCVALITHGDVIKAALAYCTGAPLDLFHRVEISPASVSAVMIADQGPWVACINNTESLRELPFF
jgi:probable phosphoglycerate mutase